MRDKCLHRIVLLPFTNWQEVPLLITPTGLRHTAPARDVFLTELLVRQIRHTSIVDFARRVVTGTSGPAGYGFDASGGTALPAVLREPPLTAPRHLLTCRTDPAAEATVTYTAEVQDYYAAPRTLVEDLPPIGTTSGPLSARTVTAPVTDETRTAGIEATHDRTTARVGLGQALRGHRYAQRPDPASAEAHSDVTPRTAAARSALRAPGLVWTQAGDVTLDATGQDDLVVPTLLGRLYPENVTLRPVGRSTARTHTGGTGPTAW